MARACYICKQRHTVVDAFYHQLCPECAALNHAKRNARTGKRALLTGGRANVNMLTRTSAREMTDDGAST